MKWAITLSALLVFLFIILVTGGVWNITLKPDRILEVPTTIWLTLLMMIFIVILCIIAGNASNSRKDDQI